MCFAVCIVARVDYHLHSPQALVVVPTRELALQNEKVIQIIGKYLGITTITTAKTDEVHKKGQPITEQVSITIISNFNLNLIKVVVGTIGSLFIWNRKRFLFYDQLKILSLDEADNLLSKEYFADDTYR